MKKDVKMIVTDLDNTLLHRDKTISDFTVDVFNRCRERGIFIAFATSRSEVASARFTARIKPDIFISNGGAMIRRDESVIYKATLTADFTNALIAELRKTPNILQYTVEADKGYFNSKPIDPTWSGWVDYTHSIHADFTTPIEYGDVYKITIQVGDTQELYETILKHPTINTIQFSGENWCQIKAQEATKERACAQLCEVIGIAIADTVAFGDDSNDTYMIRNCGIGVAVCNAVPEVKSVADFICGDCDEDGVAKWLEENVL